jgi:hypothetical protein
MAGMWFMPPNLERISGDRDADGLAILERAPDPIDHGFLESLALRRGCG